MSQAPASPPAAPRGAGYVPSDERYGRPPSGWRARLFRVIFESDTRAGLLFDQALIVLILASLVVVVADSVESLQARWGGVFYVLEWVFTLLFTLEYLLRLACVTRPARYARSFFGVIDLLAILPTYLALFFPGLHALIDVRVLRLLRVFRIFKLTTFMREYQTLGGALLASWRTATSPTSASNAKAQRQNSTASRSPLPCCRASCAFSRRALSPITKAASSTSTRVCCRPSPA